MKLPRDLSGAGKHFDQRRPATRGIEKEEILRHF
jgi:hypothetical protein